MAVPALQMREPRWEGTWGGTRLEGSEMNKWPWPRPWGPGEAARAAPPPQIEPLHPSQELVPLGMKRGSASPSSLKRHNPWGARVAQSVKRPTSAQVMILWLVSSSPCVGLCADSSEPGAGAQSWGPAGSLAGVAPATFFSPHEHPAWASDSRVTLALWVRPGN